MFATLDMLCVCINNRVISSDKETTEINQLLMKDWATADYNEMYQRIRSSSYKFGDITLKGIYENEYFQKPMRSFYSAQCRDSLISSILFWTKPLHIHSVCRYTRIFCKMGSSSFSDAYFNKAKFISSFPAIRTGCNSFSFVASDFDVIRFSVFEMLLRSTDFISDEVIEDKDALIKTIIKHPRKSFPNNDGNTWLTAMLAFGIYINNYSQSGFRSGYNCPEGFSWPWFYVNGVSSAMEVWAKSHLDLFFEFLDKYKLPITFLNEIGNPFYKENGKQSALGNMITLYQIWKGEKVIVSSDKEESVELEKESSWEN